MERFEHGLQPAFLLFERWGTGLHLLHDYLRLIHLYMLGRVAHHRRGFVVGNCIDGSIRILPALPLSFDFGVNHCEVTLKLSDFEF